MASVFRDQDVDVNDPIAMSGVDISPNAWFKPGNNRDNDVW
jgi:hypothetical protein